VWSSNASRREVNPLLGARTLRTPGLKGLLFLALAAVLWVHPAGGAFGAAEVRRVGLSKVEEQTLLTVVLSQPQEAQVTTRMAAGKPQLVVDFPQARAGRLPPRLEGDDYLVNQVLTEVSPGGVRFILELFPERAYVFWKQTRPGTGGQALFVVGLRPDRAEPAPPSSRTPETYRNPEAPPEAAEPSLSQPDDYGYKEPVGSPVTGSFIELKRLMPKAGPLFASLEGEGWVVSQSHNYDRPGQRQSRDFILTNRRYPELSVKIVNLPATQANVPGINMVTLTTDNLTGETASQYQALRQWNFAKIKQQYEDIGDFFDDALKPLRVKLREETKALALRDAQVFQDFLRRACPRNPQVTQQVMDHVREKVNPRFEGVQYTVSEDPLVILNLVDFLYVRVYFLETG